MQNQNQATHLVAVEVSLERRASLPAAAVKDIVRHMIHINQRPTQQTAQPARNSEPRADRQAESRGERKMP